MVWAHGIAGMVQAAGDWWLDHPEVPRAAVVDELTALLVAGFRAPGTAPTAERSSGVHVVRYP